MLEISKLLALNIHSWLASSPCIMSVQYTEECAVQQGMFSTQGDIMSIVGDIMSTLGGSVHWGDIIGTPGDIMINVGKVIGKINEFVWKPQCTEHPLLYSRYPPVY